VSAATGSFFAHSEAAAQSALVCSSPFGNCRAFSTSAGTELDAAFSAVAGGVSAAWVRPAIAAIPTMKNRHLALADVIENMVYLHLNPADPFSHKLLFTQYLIQ
jgi:hypothetical protein